MDKFILAHLIKELILENGRAVLPGFGIFSTVSEEASFSEDGRIINPPTQRIVFQENAVLKDDLLLERYAAKMNESAESLRSRLDSIIKEIMEETVNRGSMAFSGFGTLTYHSNGTFSFHTEDEKDFFMERDGMEPILLRIVEPDAVGPDSEPEQEEPEPEPTPIPISEPLPIPISEPLPEPIIESPAEPEPIPQEKEDKRSRLQTAIIIVLTVIIIGAVLVILGRSGALDTILYTDEELELIESQNGNVQ